MATWTLKRMPGERAKSLDQKHRGSHGREKAPWRTELPEAQDLHLNTAQGQHL